MMIIPILFFILATCKNSYNNIMSAIKIRRAEKEDCPRLLALIKGLALYEKAPEEVTVTLSHFEESGFGNNPVWWAFVAEEEGTIHGFALYYIRYSTWKGQRMYLEDIYVDPQMRGKKIGAQLFERLIVEAKERKLQGMVWQVLDWNEPAINFYKKYNATFDNEWVNCAIAF
ncbi:GNAT family N-acetyltransferase [Bacteroides sp. 214]|uniref:GNAT family N-acetyltransferase n=1 Tax=Bacteroides sp. 214 TaxID=2302935 RepID=UPI00194020C3|nr:GNAT family N-acetyltransferase [Bacteroides sp. 214]